ncbi:MAG: transposase [Paludibacteraceae bacterium]|nr:transposase [Paludibacteraceae bacterium]
MKSKRRNFTAEFKAQVAIEALKGQETLAQLSERFHVSSVMISNWKSEFLNNASAAFTEKKRGDARTTSGLSVFGVPSRTSTSIFTHLTMG